MKVQRPKEVQMSEPDAKPSRIERKGRQKLIILLTGTVLNDKYWGQNFVPLSSMGLGEWNTLKACEHL